MIIIIIIYNFCGHYIKALRRLFDSVKHEGRNRRAAAGSLQLYLFNDYLAWLNFIFLFLFFKTKIQATDAKIIDGHFLHHGVFVF
jgi:hypothetical protein